VTLPDPTYHIAVEAHDEKRRVVMSGNLVTASGQTLRMIDLYFFQLEEYLNWQDPDPSDQGRRLPGA
jgi:hypothetical protein